MDIREGIQWKRVWQLVIFHIAIVLVVSFTCLVASVYVSLNEISRSQIEMQERLQRENQMMEWQYGN